MKYVLIFVIIISIISSDELDMFDVVDNESYITNTTKDSSVNALIQLDYLMQDKSDNDEKLYINLSQNEAKYAYDMRVIIDNDVQTFNIKDLYYKINKNEKYFLELGRINIKEGVARGYNPTDYFKGSAALTLSNDPKDKKDNRLGSVLLQGTAILDNITLKVIYSPKICTDEESIWRNKKYFGLHLDETNDVHRTSLYLGYTGYENTSIYGLLHYNEDDLNLGFNLSHIDERSIWYVESSIKKTSNDASELVKTLNISPIIAETFYSKKEYMPEVVFGLNYTSESNIVTAVEYIYNSGGFSNSDWDNFFILNSHFQYEEQLKELRNKLLNAEKIMSQHTVFTMVEKSDVVPSLDITLMSWLNPEDKSTLAQLSASYSYEDNMTFDVNVRTYIGSSETEYGSYINDYELLLSMAYYF